MQTATLLSLLQVVEVVLQVMERQLNHPEQASSDEVRRRNAQLIIQLLNLRATLRAWVNESNTPRTPEHESILNMMVMCASLDFYFRSLRQ